MAMKKLLRVVIRFVMGIILGAAPTLAANDVAVDLTARPSIGPSLYKESDFCDKCEVMGSQLEYEISQIDWFSKWIDNEQYNSFMERTKQLYESSLGKVLMYQLLYCKNYYLEVNKGYYIHLFGPIIGPGTD